VGLATIPFMTRSFLGLFVVLAAGCGRVLVLDDGGVSTCATRGGSCVGVSSCGRGAGYLAADNDCAGGAATVCCMPLPACGNATEFDCCSATATFRPVCQTDGTLACLAGTTRCASDGGTQDAGATCASVGGTCGAVSACNAGAGYLTGSTSDCTGAAAVCCLPLSACNSQPEFPCCSNGGTYRPSCVGGQLQCTVGTRCDADAGTQTCGALGGTCGGVSACNAGAGYLTSSTSDCTGGSTVCCLPLSACGNQAEFDCCSNGGTFRPSCIGGQLQCTAGTRCP